MLGMYGADNQTADKAWKNKRFVCPFGLKIGGGVGRSIFFFFFLVFSWNLDTDDMQYHS